MITATAGFEPNTEYLVYVDNNVIKDASDNLFEGIDGWYNFTTQVA